MTTWNPVCPHCRSAITTQAYEGDDDGPIEPEAHPLAAMLKCRRCGVPVRLEDVKEWRWELI